MIPRPLVLILGAGASCEYGLPLGDDLKAKVATNVRFRFGGPFRDLSEGSRQLLEVLKAVHRERVGEYTVAGNKLADLCPPHKSIDEVLHYRSDYPELVEVGKLAIAECILSGERDSSI